MMLSSLIPRRRHKAPPPAETDGAGATALAGMADAPVAGAPPVAALPVPAPPVPRAAEDPDLIAANEATLAAVLAALQGGGAADDPVPDTAAPATVAPPEPVAEGPAAADDAGTATARAAATPGADADARLTAEAPRTPVAGPERAAAGGGAAPDTAAAVAVDDAVPEAAADGAPGSPPATPVAVPEAGTDLPPPVAAAATASTVPAANPHEALVARVPDTVAGHAAPPAGAEPPDAGIETAASEPDTPPPEATAEPIAAAADEAIAVAVADPTATSAEAGLADSSPATPDPDPAHIPTAMIAAMVAETAAAADAPAPTPRRSRRRMALPRLPALRLPALRPPLSRLPLLRLPAFGARRNASAANPAPAAVAPAPPPPETAAAPLPGPRIAAPSPAAMRAAFSRAFAAPGTRFAAATLAPAVLVALALLLGGWVTLAAFASVTILTIALDELAIPGRTAGAQDFPVPERLSVAIAGAHAALLAVGLYALTAGTLGTLPWLLAFLSLGLWLGQVSNANAHELIHRPDPRLRSLGAGVFASLFFGHHTSAHRLVHHRWVATPDDPNTAEAGESFYAFAPRAWIGSFVAGYEMERALMRPRFGRRARKVHPYALQIGTAAACLLTAGVAFGPGAVVVYLLLAVYAQAQLLLTDYVQHYGLLRARLPGGRTEPVGPRHAWNAPQVMSGLFLLNAPSHSDHHLSPGKPYPHLTVAPGDAVPMLPHSLPVMAAIALVPPVWRRLMDPRVRDEARRREALVAAVTGADAAAGRARAEAARRPAPRPGPPAQTPRHANV
jgi:alkane 1-monooxygenase